MKREILALFSMEMKSKDDKGSKRRLTQAELEWLQGHMDQKVEEMKEEIQSIFRRRTKQMYITAGMKAEQAGRGEFDPEAKYVLSELLDLEEQFMEHQIKSMKLAHSKILQNVIRDGAVSLTQLKDEISHLYNKFQRNNADLIAQWATVKARNMGLARAYMNKGLVIHIWRALADACPVCRQMNNRVINRQKGETFARKGEIIHALDPDTADTAKLRAFEDLFHPPAHPRCRCWIEAIDDTTDFGDKVRAVIGTGVKDHQHAIEVGKLVLEEIRKRLGKELLDEEKRLAKLAKEWEKLRPADKRKKKYRQQIEEINKARQEVKVKKAQVTKEVLSEIRDMGVLDDFNHPFGTRVQIGGQLFLGDDFMVENLKTVATYFPRKWVAESAKSEKVLISHVGYPANDWEDEGSFYLFGKNFALMKINENRWFMDMLHEWGHRFEHVMPGLRNIVKQFYDYRTQNDKEEDFSKVLRDYGYRKSDARRYQGIPAKRDRFPHVYMMRDGGLELLSTGLEALFNYEGFEFDHFDDEIHQFHLGLLAGFYTR